MADREKVIRGLKQHCEGSIFDRCGECLYYDIEHESGFICRDVLLSDVNKLLKEQEPVLPRRLDAWPFTIELCGNCGEVLPSIGGNKVKFCLGCGRKVKRNDGIRKNN